MEKWEEVEPATDALVTRQIDFCGWWRENVRSQGRPENVTDTVTIFVEEAERLTGFSKMQVSRWRKALGITREVPGGKPELVDRHMVAIENAARKKAGMQPADNHRTRGTAENEWFTPENYVEKARFVLGSIDLDPASHPIAQEWIKAKRFFVAEDDALSHEWHGRVWLNPPYSRDLIANFVGKLAVEIAAQRVTAAIVLTHAYTDTSWWQQLAQLSSVVAFPRGRIRFVNDIGQPCNPTQGQTFFGCGEEIDIKAFRNEFAEIGTVRGI